MEKPAGTRPSRTRRPRNSSWVGPRKRNTTTPPRSRGPDAAPDLEPVARQSGITRSTESSGLAAVKLCLKLGASVNVANKYGDTALHGAAWRERADSIVQLLVEKGANMNAKNSRGWTPLVIAEGIHTGGKFVHSDTTAELLRRLVAEPSPPNISREPISAYGRGDIQ